MDHSAAIEKLLASPVEYRGERVVTLAQGDDVHQRPRGTWGRNFRENRARLTEGRHFFEVAPEGNDEIRRYGSPGQGGKLILLTERGYLLLVKCLRDDLAWKVQDQLVETYFRARALAGAVAGADAAILRRSDIDPLAKAVEGMRDAMSALEVKSDSRHSEIVGILKSQSDVLDRTLRIVDSKNRSGVSEANVRDYRRVVLINFNGMCPMCSKRRIVNSDGAPTPECRVEHWVRPGIADRDKCWVVCHECNYALGPAGGTLRRQDYEGDFRKFQRHLAELPPEKKAPEDKQGAFFSPEKFATFAKKH